MQPLWADPLRVLCSHNGGLVVHSVHGALTSCLLPHCRYDRGLTNSTRYMPRVKYDSDDDCIGLEVGHAQVEDVTLPPGATIPGVCRLSPSRVAMLMALLQLRGIKQHDFPELHEVSAKRGNRSSVNVTRALEIKFDKYREAVSQANAQVSLMDHGRSRAFIMPQHPILHAPLTPVASLAGQCGAVGAVQIAPFPPSFACAGRPAVHGYLRAGGPCQGRSDCLCGAGAALGQRVEAPHAHCEHATCRRGTAGAGPCQL